MSSSLRGTAGAEIAGGEAEMRTEELGELIFIPDANGGSDGLDRQVGGEEKRSGLVEAPSNGKFPLT